MKKIYFCLLFLAFNSVVYAGSAGTSGAAFLKILPGVRAQAMGGAYTALAEGVSGIHWNPAGITFSGDKEFSAMYMKWIADINYGFLGYSQPFGANSAFGVSGIYLMSKVEGRDMSGSSTGNINFSDFAGTLNYSYLINEQSSWGLNIRYIKENIDINKIKAISYDAGYLNRFIEGKVRVGIAAQNLGGQIGLSQKDSLPLNFKAGIALMPWDNKFIFAFDSNFPNDAKQRYNIGLEYCPADIIALRCGYRLNYDQKGMDAFSLGIGVVHRSEYRIGYFDLAYLPYGELGNVYKVSYTIQF